MPRPIPSYVPPLAASILRKRRWGLTDLSRETKLKYTTIVHLFKRNKHESLATFSRFCDSLQISIDDGIELLRKEENERALYIDERIRAHYQNYKEYLHTCKISPSYLYDVIHGTSGGARKILELYNPIGEALGMPASEWSATIFNTR